MDRRVTGRSGVRATALDMPEMRFHDLRHTYASLMLAAGFQPYEVSRWMGHASLVTTDTIYSHLYVSNYATHVERFDAFVAEGRH